VSDDDGEVLVDNERLDRARADIADNLGHYADGWSNVEGGIVTKWIAIAEVVSPDGDKVYMEVSSDRIVSWERAGLLHVALKLA
jgi:hypothetical protein